MSADPVRVSVAAPQRQGIPTFGAVGEPALACGHGRTSVPTAGVTASGTGDGLPGPASVKRIVPALKTFPLPQAVEHREAFMSTHTLAGPTDR